MKYRYYVVIDTNVLVAGLLSRNPVSPTVRILRLLSEGVIVPVYSKEIIDEYIEVLHRDKFGLPEEIITPIIRDITEHGIEITDLTEIPSDEEVSDPKDVVFYAVTLSAADLEAVLVTGNLKDFPSKTFVITPADFIAMIDINLKKTSDFC
ncbi:MAG: putative toxin-antitoxin system toxin component, PIN family [Spirochaetales bacterium]|nr:putative toxin-antitoxin system toxin component, PIN family [Spirochaetales bacterium]